MTKMSKAQRLAILNADAYRGARGSGYGRGIVLAGAPTVAVLVREGWARLSGSDSTARPTVTRAGLIAAGVDLDAIHAEALIENSRREYIPTAEEREIENRARALADLPPAPMCVNSQPHAGHRIAGTFRDYCPGLVEEVRGTCPAGHVDTATTDGGTCAECEQHDETTANTPPEARTGISDRAAAALGDVAELKAHLTPTGFAARHGWILERLDRIEQALRGALGQVLGEEGGHHHDEHHAPDYRGSSAVSGAEVGVGGAGGTGPPCPPEGVRNSASACDAGMSPSTTT